MRNNTITTSHYDVRIGQRIVRIMLLLLLFLVESRLWPWQAVFAFHCFQKIISHPSSSSSTSCRHHRRRRRRLSLLLLASSSSSSSSSQQQEQEQSSSSSVVTVSYQGRSCEISVASNETILAALERHNVADTLSLPTAEMPSDCRRGNCLTCAAKWSIINNQKPQQHPKPTTARAATTRTAQPILRGEDGLSPTVSDKIAELGYMLTCSSYVQGDGLELSLGENHALWDLIYRQRLESDETQIAARQAMARVIRKSAERNVPRWKRETEEVLRKSGDS